jgi:hypothetical protein
MNTFPIVKHQSFQSSLRVLSSKLVLSALLVIVPHFVEAKGAPVVFHVKDQAAEKATLQAMHPDVLACINRAGEKAVLEPTGYSALSWTLAALETAKVSSPESVEHPLEVIQIDAKGRLRGVAQKNPWQDVMVVCQVANGQAQQVSVSPR